MQQKQSDPVYYGPTWEHVIEVVDLVNPWVPDHYVIVYTIDLHDPSPVVFTWDEWKNQ